MSEQPARVVSRKPWPVHERACYLELSGLRDPYEACGSCHYLAGQHRAWRHRAKVWPEQATSAHEAYPAPTDTELMEGGRELARAAERTVPAPVPATPANVQAALSGATPGLFLIALPEDVREVGAALYDASAIFWLNPERSASRWRSKDAISHACAACSHALQHVRGREIDADTGRPHLHLAAARMLLAVAAHRIAKGET